jgi:hypothetical protein
MSFSLTPEDWGSVVGMGRRWTCPKDNRRDC